MKLRLFVPLLLMVLTWSINGFCDAETCNSTAGITGIAHYSAGVSWQYFYRGKTYETSYTELLQGLGPVKYTSEKVVSVSCVGGLSRDSMRHIILYDQNGNLVVEDDLRCAGSFMPIPQTNPCL